MAHEGSRSGGNSELARRDTALVKISGAIGAFAGLWIIYRAIVEAFRAMASGF